MEMKAVAEDFIQRSCMPGVVGAIEESHIPIHVPQSEDHASYHFMSSFQMTFQFKSNTNIMIKYFILKNGIAITVMAISSFSIIIH